LDNSDYKTQPHQVRNDHHLSTSHTKRSDHPAEMPPRKPLDCPHAAAR
jgi:hypothetical protein